MRSHLKVYFNFEEDTQALNDSEKGRLLLAMVRYAKDGAESNLSGNERFLFPVFKAQIDRDIESYEIKVSNGLKGGRPKNEDKPEETEENLKKPNETETNQEESKKTETPKIEDRRQKIEDKRKKIEDSNRRFTPPTLAEVRDYCQERGNNVNPERFIDFYSSKGWRVGNQPMKDWKAAVRTWEQRDSQKPVQQKTVVAQQYDQRDYSRTPEEEKQNLTNILDIMSRAMT